MTKRTSRKPVTKDAWAKANDAGPHLATLPSGAVVRFRIAEASALLRSGRLPEPLRITATLAGAHRDGVNGYMQDMVDTAVMRGGDAQVTIAGAINQGVELAHHLIAEMLVEPAVTPEDVASGMFHELDIRMLLEFAERRRNTDADGNVLPIVVLGPDEWATFRRVGDDAGGAGDGGANGADAGAGVSDADERAV
jgi:hypothetical protein